MKVKYLGALIVLLTFFGCDDNTAGLGLDMLPGSDKLTVKTKTFDVKTKSVLVDSVYAKTSIGYVGKFSDPYFGYYDAGFLTQFNCTEWLKFPKQYNRETREGDLTGDTIDWVRITLGYQTYFGDSLNASRMSIYELMDAKVKPLDKNYYTTIDPEEYYDKNKLLARKAYTAVDQSISDSLRKANGYYNNISFYLNKEFGNEILRHNWHTPGDFANAKTFIENVFPGIYVKNDYGDGTILYIDQAILDIGYTCFRKDSLGNIYKTVAGTDSTYDSGKTFAATKEVIQLNNFTNGKDEIKKRVAEENWTYLKSPAGIFTQATLPIQDIYDQLSNDTLNSVKLTFTGYQPEAIYENIDKMFRMGAPAQILLVREKDMISFFEENKLTDNTTSFLASAATTNYSYTFNNITFLINTCINEKKKVMEGEGKNWTKEEWDKWEEDTKWNSVMLVPVSLTLDSSKSIISIQNDLKPGYVKLKGGDEKEGGENLKMEVHYTVHH